MDFIVKSDSTPLTQADKISHSLITEALKKMDQHAADMGHIDTDMDHEGDEDGDY